MKLKCLEIQGFKSFDDNTVINFDNSITGVVGPNGCGKSNIVDAIRWVMGEQSAKHLRGRSMEDIIFSGTQERAPNSLASVELTFITDGKHGPPQYSSCKEISIGRKLYRTGESEYYINRQPVRLKDITDLFLGTGVGTKAYSIIEQGRVGQVVMAKSEERRSIIEEAAGISKFKSRKEAALRRMESTRVNLSRLHDILAEIERQKVSLERQAKKAERFKLIKDEFMELDLNLAALGFQKLDKQQNELLQNIKELDGQEQILQNKVTEDETWVEEERLKLVEIETVLNDLHQEVFEWDNSLKLSESKLQTKKDEVQRYGQNISQFQSQVEEHHKAFQGSKNGLTQVNEKLAVAELECCALDDTVSDQESDLTELQDSSQKLFTILEKAREDYNEANGKLSENSAHRENITDRLNELTQTKEADQTELEALTKKYKELEKLLKGSNIDLSTIKQLKLSLGERTESLTEYLKEEEENINKDQESLAQLKEELLQKKSRLQSLEELERNFEGYQEGPRQILKRKNEGELDGVLGSVAEIIETDSRFENAVSAVLGERMQYLVVKDQDKGVQCAEYLKAEQAGRSSFIPVSFQSSNEGTDQSGGSIVTSGDRPAGFNVYTDNYLKIGDFDHSNEDWSGSKDDSNDQAVDIAGYEGVKGYLQNFVSLKPGYKNLNVILFGDVLLADSLQNALDAWAGLKKPVVTFDGEFISHDGILTGGTLENTSKALLQTKREIKELGDLVQGLVDQVKEKEEICFDLNHKIQSLKSELEEIKTSCHEEDLKLAKQEKDVTHFNQELETINTRRGKLSQQIFNATETIEDLTGQLDVIKSSEDEYQEKFDHAADILENKKSQEEQCRLDLAKHQEDLTKEKIKFAQSKEQKAFLSQEVDRLIAEQNRLVNEMFRLEEQQKLFIKKKIFVEDRVLFLEKNIKRILKNKDEVDTKYVQQKNEFEITNQTLTDRDHRLKQERHEYSKIKDDLNDSTVKLTEVRGDISRVGEQILERYHMILSDVFKEHLPDVETFDLVASEERADELRQKLSNIGNVNLAAIDELNEISERFEFLEKQRLDLEESLDSLDRAIQKINRTTRERFKQTFELVNEKFTKLFPRLFKGGHAYLELTDPENILETGIDIIAQPPGKKLQSISLLSGGEKALTAVSLLFAIFLIKPAPFCLLDEVDAPLDDANVDRYNDIVKEMAQRTQFIVITHNKRTMQVTDCLFGVTMQQAGVSQLVSVHLN